MGCMMNPDHDSPSDRDQTGDPSREPPAKFVQQLGELHERVLAGDLHESDRSHGLPPKDADTSDSPDGSQPPMDALIRLLSVLEEIRRQGPPDDTQIESCNSPVSPLVEAMPDQAPELGQRTDDDSNQDNDPALGLRIGRFEIRARLGQGGFGMVFQAYDERLDRVVALKIPRPEAILSPVHRRRFLAEARAAAALNHPRIVAVWETGTEGPICYIASDYVPGINLAEWRQSQNNVDMRSIAEIMSQLADAVQHAHSRNVLHRDLKPSNILIFDGIPRITDFGLAARLDATNESLTGESLVGTPAYMSPEQAAGEGEQVDAQTDIYSLGAILYFLLSGRPPFSGSSVLEVLKRVRSQPPQPPRAVDSTIPLDLQSICLKCLEKQPEQRYKSAYNLHEDLQRYLQGKPVVARPVSSWGQLVRWSQRNPTVSFLGVATVVCLCLGILATTIGWLITSNALADAEEAQAEMLAARREANQRYLDAKQTVDEFMTRVAENEMLHVPGLTPLRNDLLRSALSHYEAFLQENQRDQQLLDEVERSHFRLGKILRDLGQPEQALEHLTASTDMLQPRIEAVDAGLDVQLRFYATLEQLAAVQYELGQLGEALGTIERAVEGQESLWSAYPQNREVATQFAEVTQRYGTLLRETRRLDEARQAIQTGVAVRSQLLETDPDDLEIQRGLARGRGDLANVLRMQGKLAEADSLASQVTADFRNLASQAGATLADRHELLMSLHNLAALKFAQRDIDAAHELLQETARIADLLASAFPGTEAHLQHPAKVRGMLAVAQLQRGEIEPALENFRRSLSASSELVQLNPQSTSLKFELAITRLNFGSALAEHTDQTEEARQSFQAVQDLANELLEATPESLPLLTMLINCENSLGSLAMSREDYAGALEHLQRGFERLEQVSPTPSPNPQLANVARMLLRNTAVAHERRSEYATAIEWWRRTLQWQPPPRDRMIRLRLAAALALAGDLTTAIEEFDRLEAMKDATDVFTQNPSLTMQHGRAAALIARGFDNTSTADVPQASQRSLEDWQQLALESLQQAIDLGIDSQDLEYLATSEELKHLRSLNGFPSMESTRR